MAKIYCMKCGLEGDSKCPFCRSIFATSKNGTLDTIASYFFVLDDEKYVKVRLPRDEDHGGCVIVLRDFLKDLTDEQCRIVACCHSWTFSPCSHSEIGCGHGSEEKPLVQFKQDILLHLAGVDEEAFNLVDKIWSKK